MGWTKLPKFRNGGRWNWTTVPSTDGSALYRATTAPHCFLTLGCKETVRQATTATTTLKRYKHQQQQENHEQQQLNHQQQPNQLQKQQQNNHMQQPKQLQQQQQQQQHKAISNMTPTTWPTIASVTQASWGGSTLSPSTLPGDLLGCSCICNRQGGLIPD